MGKFQIEKCEDIEGLYLIQPTVFGDSRGYFMETYNYEEENQDLAHTPSEWCDSC